MADDEKRRNRRTKQGLTEEQVRATVRKPAQLSRAEHGCIWLSAPTMTCVSVCCVAYFCLLLAAARDSGGV
jgi:hypothetical protein